MATNTKKSATKAPKAPVIALSATERAFVSDVHNLSVMRTNTDNAIFAVAAQIERILPRELKDASETTVNGGEVLRLALDNPDMRGIARRYLMGLLGTRPKADDTKPAMRAAFDRWNAAAQNIDRALHVAAIVASKRLGNVTGNWEGATFWVDASHLLNTLKLKPVGKMPDSFRLIFGKKSPEFIVALDKTRVKSVKASFATLAAAYPKAKSGQGAGAASKVAKQFGTIANGLLNQLDTKINKTFDETQQKVLLQIVAKINARLGIATTERVPAPRKARTPRKASEQPDTAAA